MRKLMLHDWPGNVRELENVLEDAAAVTRRDVITEELLLQTRPPSTEEKLGSLKEARDAFERGYLIKSSKPASSTSEASDLAGRGRSDFYSLLKKHDLDPAWITALTLTGASRTIVVRLSVPSASSVRPALLHRTQPVRILCCES